MSNEIHLLDITLVADDCFSWGVDSTVHGDDKLVGESSLAFLEEMVEGSLELLEDSSVLDKVSLHLWGNLLVELELFDDQVEIVQEGLLNILSNVIIQGWLDMERLIGLLDFLNPHVKGI